MDSHEDLRNPLRRRLGGPQTAEDVLHEAVARALERANQLRESESVRRWFGRIVANALADHFRRTPKRRRGMRRQAQYLIADAIVDDELDAVRVEFAINTLDAERRHSITVVVDLPWAQIGGGVSDRTGGVDRQRCGADRSTAPQTPSAGRCDR
jgi:DNA-directed RNA polymerase specialized sigma24 family protein